MLDFALLSAAHIHTPSYVNEIREHNDCRIVAVWDDVEDRGHRFAENAQCEFFTDLHDVLTRNNVDGFLICSNNADHLSLLNAVIPLGRPILCEKPLATTVADASNVLRLIERYRADVLLCYFMPFWAEMQGVAALLQSEKLGNITHAWMRNSHGGAYQRLFDKPDLAWFTNPQQAGGGAFMDLGTHAVHLVRTLLGRVDRVLARIGNASGAYPDVDDFGTTQFEMRSGVRVTVEASWVQTGGHNGLELTGSKGTLFNHPDRGYVISTADGLEDLEPQAARPVRIARLLAAISGTLPAEDVQADLTYAADTVAIVEACYQSSETGGWVDVEFVI